MLNTEHKPQTIISIFNHCFEFTENTQLVLGGDEPLYLPALSTFEDNTPSTFHRIIFAHGYFSSALHEISHWCIAGEKRRLLLDYGYWYEPDGRTADAQAKFAAVESRPQAIEWVLSKSCAKPFHVSLDNLNAELNDFGEFKAAIVMQIEYLKRAGLPPRAAILQAHLARHYNVQTPWQQSAFLVSELD